MPHTPDGPRGLTNEIIRLSELIQENPRDARHRFDRANCHRRNGSHDLAILDYNLALALDPSFPEAYFYKAVCCAKLGYTLEEITAYEQFLVYAGESLAVYFEPIKRRIRELRSRRQNYKQVKSFRQRNWRSGARR